jgi:hypothetical protein
MAAREILLLALYIYSNSGPELFTFDNHNPKGGCVLLNDGTVKSIPLDEASYLTG